MKVNFGIMGLGGIAHRFAGVLKTVENVELAAVASMDECRARKFADEYGAGKYFGDYTLLAADPSVDVVYIAQTHDRHYELIKLCIENKKGVLCEKPMVLTKAQAEEVTTLAKNNNVLLMEAMWTRCLPTFQKAREWVTGGRIGKVKLVQASFCFHFPYNSKHRLFDKEKAGGSLYDAGVYPIEFATGILGEYPTEVKAVGTLCETGVDDYIAMSMRFGSGALASLSCGISAGTSTDAYIYGDSGYVVVYNFLGSHKVECYDKNRELCEAFEADFADGFSYEIEHFAELFRIGRIESGLITHQDNIVTTEIFECVMGEIHRIS